MAAMQPDSLEILEQAHIPPEQARAFVRAMKIEVSRATDTLATRHDMELVRHEMTEMRQGLELKIEGLRGSLETKIEAMRGSIVVQLYAALFAAMTFLVGVAYLFVTHLKS